MEVERAQLQQELDSTRAQMEQLWTAYATLQRRLAAKEAYLTTERTFFTHISGDRALSQQIVNALARWSLDREAGLDTQFVNSTLFALHVPGSQLWSRIDCEDKADTRFTDTFVRERLVEGQCPFLSVGCGNGSFERALVSMQQQLPSAGDGRSPWNNVRMSPGPFNEAKVILDEDIPRDSVIDAVDARNLQLANISTLPEEFDCLFNCPWSEDVDVLLQDFMHSAWNLQHRGSYLFLGLSELSPFLRKYGVTSVIRNVRGKYRLKWIDCGIHAAAFQEGFTHHSDIRNIDSKIRHGSCAMLCFQKL
ncbi:hypothetical protein BC830DRAFT_1155542 [Chytriomyces sp. MP71]|nr:hypothetical protein BC830DRAFT_1155542 [Chytriomyces sp. MP71]